jgi:U3 small nucleolar RNA-associated protein 23
MGVYQHSFGFREPYQIIVDGNFIKVAQNARLDYKSMLQETVVGKTRIMTTNCVLNELRTLGEDFMGAALAAKRLEKRRCTHGGNPVNAADCIKEIIGDSNQFNYCVATQDLQLRDYLRRIPGIPLIYINRSVMILEPPSPATENKVKEIEYNKTIPTNYESTIIKNNTKQPEEAPKSKKRKGPKQPNPLSCKKKKVNPQQQQQQQQQQQNKKKKEEESENNEDAEVEKPKKRRRRRTKKKNHDTKNNEDNKEDFNNKTNEE